MEIFTIPYLTPLAAALVAVFSARQYFTHAEKLGIKYLLTPMITALIAGFVVLSMRDNGMTSYRVCILAALIFSLIADTMLMVVEVNLMRHGIVYFMLAHIMYIGAFSLDYRFAWWNLAVIAAMGLLLLMFYRGIKGHVGKMEIAVLIYAMVLCGMLFFALTSIVQGITRTSVMILVGAIMFFISDFLLSYLTFIHPHRHESVIVWSLYAPAQLLFALSCFS